MEFGRVKVHAAISNDIYIQIIIYIFFISDWVFLSINNRTTRRVKT